MNVFIENGIIVFPGNEDVVLEIHFTYLHYLNRTFKTAGGFNGDEVTFLYLVYISELLRDNYSGVIKL